MRPLGVMILVVAGAFAACHHSNPAAPSTGDLTGSWRATSARFTSVANSNVTSEVVSKGTSVVLTLDAAGTATLTITDPGESPSVAKANWTASSDELTLAWTTAMGEAQFDMTLSGNTLTLSGGHVPYDVDGNGTIDEAILSVTLARQ